MNESEIWVATMICIGCALMIGFILGGVSEELQCREDIKISDLCTDEGYQEVIQEDDDDYCLDVLNGKVRTAKIINVHGEYKLECGIGSLECD